MNEPKKYVQIQNMFFFSKIRNRMSKTALQKTRNVITKFVIF